MTFVITYPESAFTSLGSNQVRRRRLQQAILAEPAITDTLEDIRPVNYGGGSPDTSSATGRIWGFYFAGSGPSMAGSGQTALDAIIAAHNGAHIEPDSPVSGGSDGQVWGWASGAPGWRAGGGGGITGPGTTIAGRLPTWGDATGTTLAQSGITVSGASSNNLSGIGTVSIAGNLILSSAGATVDNVDMDKVVRGTTTTPLGTVAWRIPRSADTGGVNVEASLASVDNNGTIIAAGSVSGAPPLSWNMNGVAGALNVRTSTPVNNLSATQSYCLVNGAASNDDAGLWFNRGNSGNALEWYLMGPPGFFDGFICTWSSTTSVTVGPGCLCLVATGNRGNMHVVNTTFTINLNLTAQPLGTDAGSWTANTTFYIFLIRSNTGEYSICCSSNASAPNLTGGSFTSSGYINIARIGHIRTSTSAGQCVQFFDSGRSNLRKRFVDESTSVFRPLASGSATSPTQVVVAAGAQSMTAAVTTNGTAAVNFYINTSDNDRAVVATVPINQTAVERVFPILNANGAFVYKNASTSGATTVNVLAYEYEAYGPP